MNSTKCPHCGYYNPTVFYRCKNCREIISDKWYEQSLEPTIAPNDSETRPKKRYNLKKVIIYGLVVITLIIAAVTNPSEAESKRMIRSEVITKVNDKLKAEINDKNKSGDQQFGLMLGMLFAPAIIDSFVTIDVNNYFVFSTFKASADSEEEQKNIASGIILFGQVITFSSDIE